MKRGGYSWNLMGKLIGRAEQSDVVVIIPSGGLSSHFQLPNDDVYASVHMVFDASSPEPRPGDHEGPGQNSEDTAQHKAKQADGGLGT
jgi:hypothetical protein